MMKRNNITNSMVTLCLRSIVFTLFVLLSVGKVGAQVELPSTVTPEAEAYFQSLIPERDTTYSALAKEGRNNTFLKRWSFHTNLVDWMTTLPNVGVEFDLSATPKTHWSVLAFAKYNPNTKFNFNNKLVFNVQSIRLEARKYWRTGSIGKNYNDHRNEFVPLHVKRPYREELDSTLINLVRTPHYTGKDSIISLKYNGDPYRSSAYNRYHKLRRRLSTRTIYDPRNWRAYYVGVWAGVEKWSLNFNKKGKQGSGFGAGVSAGWSIPMLPQRFPKEGSLDLDLGMSVGLKMVRYDGYRYDSNTGCYEYSSKDSKDNLHIVPFPVIQDVHVGLVWRFRSIANKVDLALVDDYVKVIDRFKEKRDAARDSAHAYTKLQRELTLKKRQRDSFVADSTSFWDRYHGRRLTNALKINPDTVFQDNDYKLYLKILRGIDPTPENIKKLEQQAAAERKQAIADSIKAAKILAYKLEQQADSIRRDSIQAAKAEKKNSKKKGKSQVVPTDSLASTEGQDSLTLVTDSLGEAVVDTLNTETPAVDEEQTDSPVTDGENPDEPTADEEKSEDPVADEQTPTDTEVEEEQTEEPDAGEVKSDMPMDEEGETEEPAAEEGTTETPTVEEEQPEEPEVSEEQPDQPVAGEDSNETPTVEEDKSEEPVVNEEQSETPTVEEKQTEEPTVEQEQPEEPIVEEEKSEEPVVENKDNEEPATEEGNEEPEVKEEQSEETLEGESDSEDNEQEKGDEE